MAKGSSTIITFYKISKNASNVHKITKYEIVLEKYQDKQTEDETRSDLLMHVNKNRSYAPRRKMVTDKYSEFENNAI